MEVAYKPTTEYKQEYFTPATKTPLISSLLQMGTRIVAQGQLTKSTAGTDATTIYTVPAGKVFFLFNTTLETYHTGYLLTGSIYVNTTEVLCFISDQTTAISLPTNRQQWLFQQPVRLNEGEKIILVETLTGSASAYVNCSIFGYELDTSALPNLF